MSRQSNVYAGGESDGCVLPSKWPNKGGQPPAEAMEERQPTKENIEQATAPRTQSRISELGDLLGVRKAARKDRRMRFTTLLHHVNGQPANPSRDLSSAAFQESLHTESRWTATSLALQPWRIKSFSRQW
jgi:hypothetical protein